MADISAEKVKELRERTGAGFMDCKNALVEADGDVEKATAVLREKGLAAAAKKAITCSACGELDYMPVGGDWRRCWSCGHRWGPPGPAAPEEGTFGDLARADFQPQRPLRPVDRCRTHELYAHRGDHSAWWYPRQYEQPLCGLCHPDPRRFHHAI